MKRNGSLLIVEGDRSLRIALQRLLMPHFEEVVATSSPVTVPRLLREGTWRAVLLEVGGKAKPGGGKEDLYWLHEVKRLQPEIPVVLIMTFAEISLGVRGMSKGAVEFVAKPCNIQKLAKLLIDVVDADEAAHFVKEPVEPYGSIYRSEGAETRPLLEEEVLPVAERLIARFCRQYGRRPMSLTKEAARRLMDYPWNGNVDELAYAVEKAVILCDGREITAELFPFSGWVMREKRLKLRQTADEGNAPNGKRDSDRNIGINKGI